jgi:hypothetical protein
LTSIWRRRERVSGMLSTTRSTARSQSSIFVCVSRFRRMSTIFKLPPSSFKLDGIHFRRCLCLIMLARQSLPCSVIYTFWSCSNSWFGHCQMHVTLPRISRDIPSTY